MKTFSRRSALTLIMLAVLSAGSTSSATGFFWGGFSWPWSNPPLTKEQVVNEALQRYQTLNDDISLKYPDNPEWVEQITKAQTYFKEQSDGYLRDDLPYSEESLRRMRRMISVQILGEEKAIALRIRGQQEGWNQHKIETGVQALMVQTAEEVKIAAMPERPADHSPAAQDAQAGDRAPAAQDPQAGDAGEDGGAHTASSLPDSTGHAPRGGWDPGRTEAASLVANLTLASLECAQKGNCAAPQPLPPIPVDPVPEPPVDQPGTVTPSPAQPTPAQPLPNVPNQGGEEPPVPIVLPPNWHRNAAATATGPGAMNGMIRGGALAADRGDYSRAMSLAKAALSSDPANKDALALLYSVKGRADAASAGGESWGAAKAGASSLGAGAREPGAFAAASPPSGSAAAVVSPGAVRAATEHARAGAMNAMKLGDGEGALSILTKALGNDPENPALLNLRAQTYGRLGRWEEAYKDASAGLALVPGNMALLTTKALTENRTRRWRDALATSERMIAADPRAPWGYANRAHAWAGLGNRDAMLSDINRAAALDPRFRQAAADAALLQLPADGDVLFLFPGEAAKGAAKAPVPAGRGRSFSVVVGAGIVGGLLLALGLLTTVLAPLKDTVVSVFTRAKRTGPAANTAVATAEPASVAGNVGGLIRGQYEILRQIGAGGMGMVYEGTDRSLGRRVAIKKMREELRVNARERDRFIIEAKTVASLHHPNIVDIYAIAEEGSDVYLVFEYVDGKTVHDLVQGAGRLDPAESVRVTRAMGEALTYAHAHGVIHRDMKPSNVMVTAAGQVKVMDFGIARMAKDALTRYSMTNTVVGTPPYMAPEQEQGVVRKESDVYSLAICSYEMLTGKMPFIGIGAGMLMNKINMSYIPPSRAIAGLPEALDEVFLKAFQADPDRRYRTPLEFVTALAAAAGGARKTA